MKFHFVLPKSPLPTFYKDDRQFGRPALPPCLATEVLVNNKNQPSCLGTPNIFSKHVYKKLQSTKVL